MFEVRCHEKYGPVWRSVRLMDRSVTNILDVVEKMSKVSNCLPEGDPYSMFIDEANTFFEIDKVGLIAVFPWNEQVLHCHITFWDGRLRGREQLCRDLALLVTGITKKRLITGLPDTPRMRHVLAFTKRAGFVETVRDEQAVYLEFTNYRE